MKNIFLKSWKNKGKKRESHKRPRAMRQKEYNINININKIWYYIYLVCSNLAIDSYNLYCGSLVCPGLATCKKCSFNIKIFPNFSFKHDVKPLLPIGFNITVENQSHWFEKDVHRHKALLWWQTQLFES